MFTVAPRSMMRRRELHRGLGSLPHTLCFAVKSNGNLAILKHIAKAGNGFDIVSGGELEMLRMIGVRGDRIVFSGVGKKREEIREALQYRVAGNRKTQRDGDRRGILLFNIESEAELEVLLEEASRSVRAWRQIAFRFDSRESGCAGGRASAYFHGALPA